MATARCIAAVPSLNHAILDSGTMRFGLCYGGCTDVTAALVSQSFHNVLLRVATARAAACATLQKHTVLQLRLLLNHPKWLAALAAAATLLRVNGGGVGMSCEPFYDALLRAATACPSA
jgi:hypothetical protein